MRKIILILTVTIMSFVSLTNTASAEYVRNDPINLTDPTGMCPVCVVPAVIEGGKWLVVGAIALTTAVYVGDDVVEAATGTSDGTVFGDNVLHSVAETLESRATRPLGDLEPMTGPAHSAPRPGLQGLTDEELLDTVLNPEDGQGVKVIGKGNKLRDGNGRIIELQGRDVDPDTEIPVDELEEGEDMAPWETDD